MPLGSSSATPMMSPGARPATADPPSEGPTGSEGRLCVSGYRVRTSVFPFEGRQIDRTSPPIARSAMLGFKWCHRGAMGARRLCLHHFVGLDDPALQIGREGLCAILVNPVVGVSQERDGVLQRRPLVGAAL